MPSVAEWDRNPLVKHKEKRSYYNYAFDFPPHILDNDLLEDRVSEVRVIYQSPSPSRPRSHTQKQEQLCEWLGSSQGLSILKSAVHNLVQAKNWVGLPTSPPQDPSPQGSPSPRLKMIIGRNLTEPHTDSGAWQYAFIAMGKSKRKRTGWSPFSTVRWWTSPYEHRGHSPESARLPLGRAVATFPDENSACVCVCLSKRWRRGREAAWDETEKSVHKKEWRFPSNIPICTAGNRVLSK